MYDRKSTETTPPDYSKLMAELRHISHSITQAPNDTNFIKIKKICQEYALFSWDNIQGNQSEKITSALDSANKKLKNIKNPSQINKTAILTSLSVLVNRLAEHTFQSEELKQRDQQSTGLPQGLKDIITSIDKFKKTFDESAHKVHNIEQKTKKVTRSEREINKLKVLFLQFITTCFHAGYLKKSQQKFPSSDEARNCLKELSENIYLRFPNLADKLMSYAEEITNIYSSLDKHTENLKAVENNAKEIGLFFPVLISFAETLTSLISDLKSHPQQIKEHQELATELLNNSIENYQKYSYPNDSKNTTSSETDNFSTKITRTLESVTKENPSPILSSLNQHMKDLIGLYLELAPDNLNLITEKIEVYRNYFIEKDVHEKSEYEAFINFCNSVLIPYCAKEEIFSQVKFDPYVLKDILNSIFNTLTKNDTDENYSDLKINIFNALEIIDAHQKFLITPQIKEHAIPISSSSVTNTTPKVVAEEKAPQRSKKSALDNPIFSPSAPSTKGVTIEKKQHGEYPSLNILIDITKQLQDLNVQLKKPEELTRGRDTNANAAFNTYPKRYYEQVFKRTCIAAKIDPDDQQYIFNLQKYAYRCYQAILAECEKLNITPPTKLPTRPTYSLVKEAFNKLQSKINFLEPEKDSNFPILFATFREIEALLISIPTTMDRYKKAHKYAESLKPVEPSNPIGTPVNFNFNQVSKRGMRLNKMLQDRDNKPNSSSVSTTESDKQIAEGFRPLPISRQDIDAVNLWPAVSELGTLAEREEGEEYRQRLS